MNPDMSYNFMNPDMSYKDNINNIKFLINNSNFPQKKRDELFKRLEKQIKEFTILKQGNSSGYYELLNKYTFIERKIDNILYLELLINLNGNILNY
jgi:hypothetical protein